MCFFYFTFSEMLLLHTTSKHSKHLQYSDFKHLQYSDTHRTTFKELNLTTESRSTTRVLVSPLCSWEKKDLAALTPSVPK